jgi:hypothetical protein
MPQTVYLRLGHLMCATAQLKGMKSNVPLEPRLKATETLTGSVLQ